MAIEGVEALHQLKAIDPPVWLTPSPDLSQIARKASQHLFSSLKPFCPKPMFDTLLVQGFDAEQIWQQIDLQTQPLIANLRRDVKRFERNQEEILKLFGGKMAIKSEEKQKDEGLGEESDGDDEGFNDEENEENGDSDEDEEDQEEGEREEEEEEERSDREFEDRFLKMNELEEYMEKDEAREYGGAGEKDTDEDEDEDDDDGGIGGFENDSDGEVGAEQARYEDFFGSKKKKVSQKTFKPRNESEDEDEEQEDEEQDDDDGQEDDGQDDCQEGDGLHNQTNESLSTHEKQLKKQRAKIEQLEKENLEKSSWTMQGEVTASKRPKNSALEVDLDFERNARPMPVITEEVTASLEELIKKRILEEHFDDVQKAPSLPTKAPKEMKELDENKSKKGLAEIYEEEFVQQTGLGTGPASSTDELKKEAQLLFDKLCLKLDALSHFHFKPKPVIEDMSIQTNVPALAMEEIAPVAVSDAAMLAPEEVFAGKGDIKEEAELTQADRKRRRANKKRKFKAEESKRVVKKVQDKTPTNNVNGMEA